MSDISLVDDMLEEWRAKYVDPYIASRRIQLGDKLKYTKWTSGKKKRKK